MGRVLTKSLSYTHISNSVNKALDYIDGRRKGLINSLRTGLPKLDKATLDGLEWGRIFTIAGMSGSGKSTICEQLKRQMIENNRDQAFDILSFEFEMLSQDQVARNLSGSLGMSTSKLYSADGTVDDTQFEKVKKEAEKMKHYPIYYVDTIGSVDQVASTIMDFVDKRKDKSRGLIVTLDHILLTKGIQGQGEKEVVDSLMHKCVELKKYFDSKGDKVMFILLAQLNRGIETPERVMNANLHYPTKNDIFGASSVYYSSDYVLISHKPVVVDGIHQWYGPPREGYPSGLPVFNPSTPKQPMVYWHIIKKRFGESTILMMVDEFSKSKVGEYKPA